MIKKPSISIFGLGRVGGVLQKSLSDSDYQIKSAFIRDTFPDSADQLGDLIFLAVQDSEIGNLTNKLTASFPDYSGKFIIHCSGTLDASVLEPFRSKGAKIASFHPLKAITLNDDSLENVWFDMDGDDDALKILEKLAKDFKANSFKVKPEAKPLLHAAAVVSANYVVTLMKLATDLAKAGDIDPEVALKALLPLTESSVSNIKEKGFQDALTGPIARGDEETIKAHVKILKKHPDLLSIYKKLGYLTVELTRLDTVSKEKLKKLLE